MSSLIAKFCSSFFPVDAQKSMDRKIEKNKVECKFKISH